MLLKSILTVTLSIKNSFDYTYDSTPSAVLFINDNIKPRTTYDTSLYAVFRYENRRMADIAYIQTTHLEKVKKTQHYELRIFNTII